MASSGSLCTERPKPSAVAVPLLSRPLLISTLADRERVMGADHPAILATRNNLAIAYRAAGRTAGAITLNEQRP